MPGRSRAHCIYHWFVPRHDLVLHFCMFLSPFTVTSSCSSHLEFTKNYFNPRPTCSLSLWSQVWWHLFHSYAFSLLFSWRLFPLHSLAKSYPDATFLLSFSVTVGEVVRNVMLYSHTCQPGSPVTAGVVVNGSPWPWATHEEFWINL